MEEYAEDIDYYRGQLTAAQVIVGRLIKGMPVNEREALVNPLKKMHRDPLFRKKKSFDLGFLDFCEKVKEGSNMLGDSLDDVLPEE